MGLKFHIFKIQAKFGSQLTPHYGVHAGSHQQLGTDESAAATLMDHASINDPADREKADDKLQALEKRVSDLLNREKNDKEALEKRISQFNQDKQALEKQVHELTLKLEKCCCGGAKGGSAE
ncbi:hypothetical protein MKX01_016914 [Papaver californicum]|nr:hypothetical protein MKX01_016914 [Papaver californicum]